MQKIVNRNHGIGLGFQCGEVGRYPVSPEKFGKKQASVRASGRQESVYLSWSWGLERGRDRNVVLSFGLGNETCQVRRGLSKTGVTFQKLSRNEKLGIAVHVRNLSTHEAEAGGLP